MTLANLFPWQRCQVDQIQLVCLCNENDVKRFGFSEILKPIVSDIKLLETIGIKVNDKIVKGSVIAVLGDNLGSH